MNNRTNPHATHPAVTLLTPAPATAIRYTIEGQHYHYHDYPGATYHNNLLYLDGGLPAIIRRTYELTCLEHYGTFSQVTQQLAAENPLNSSYTDLNLFYTYKLNKLLMALAQGMHPDEPWNGRYDPYLNLTIPRHNAAPYHLRFQDYNAAEDYLYTHTRLTAFPSQPYTGENGERFIELNVEIGIEDI